jgi:hypothetical protein
MRALIELSKEPCMCCGEVAALNPHRICAAKVATLGMLAKGRLHGEGWCRCENGRGFRVEETGKWISGPYRVNAHALRLYWFGLAEQKAPRDGLYRITANGLRFMRGNIGVPTRILCRAGSVRYISEEIVRLDDVKDVVLDKAYWDTYPWSDFLP